MGGGLLKSGRGVQSNFVPNYQIVLCKIFVAIYYFFKTKRYFYFFIENKTVVIIIKDF